MRYKVALATPVDGHPDDALVHLSVQQQQRRVGNILRLDELANGWVGSMDLVRARDRLARMALFESDVTHVLNWDCDVHVEDLELINRMLETGARLHRRPLPPEKAEGGVPVPTAAR